MGKDMELEYSQGCGKGPRIMLVLLFVAMAVCIVALSVVLGLQNAKSDPPNDTKTPPPEDDANQEPKSQTGRYRFAAVAADAQVCSQIGTDIMARHGGSAMDAAIAGLLCLGVIHTHSMGIGGGFLMTVYDSATDEVQSLISREVAPSGASETMYVGNVSSLSGGMAIAVPGEVAGMAAAHARYGKLPWEKLFDPSIDLCEKGFKVTNSLKKAITIKLDDIRASPTMSARFLKEDGTPLNAGDTMTRPTLAKTYRKLASDAYSFYNGTLAQDIVNDIRDNGGIIKLEDLSKYTALWKDPVSVNLSNGGYTLYGPPPPSSAAVLQYILNILDGYDMSPSDMLTTEKQILTEHRLVEAMKFGFAKRSHLGDEDFVNFTMWKEKLQSSTYADQTRAKINDSTVLDFKAYEPAFEITMDGGTSHLSVYGTDGSAVSVTSTINT